MIRPAALSLNRGIPNDLDTAPQGKWLVRIAIISYCRFFSKILDWPLTPDPGRRWSAIQS